MRFLIRTTTTFIVGALLATSLFTAVLFLNQHGLLNLTYETNFSRIISSSLEEALKFLSILALIRLITLKPSSVPFLGLGFGFAEGLIKILEHPPMYHLYYLKPFWLHIALGLLMALFFHLALKPQKRLTTALYYGLALIIPAALHITYNLSV